MSVFVLKILAVFCMVCDHIRYIDPILNNSFTMILGRIAFPIFAFLISEGCIYTRDIKKYMARLGIFAIISQIPFYLFITKCGITDKFTLNVYVTLFFGVLSIDLYKKEGKKILKFLEIVSITVFVQLINADYGALGILTILNFYIFKDKKLLKNFIYLVLFFIHMMWIINFDLNLFYAIKFYCIGYIFAIIPLLFYNEKIGKFKLKYFFYVFYPLHLLVIVFINSLLY